MTVETITADRTKDGRSRVTIHYQSGAIVYSRVRNIDGSNRFMREGGSWSFLPYELERPVRKALAAAGIEPDPWPHA
jgi:hypothetical protein